MGEWISCKDTLPGEDEPVILCVSGKEGNITYIRAVIADDGTCYENGRWYIGGLYCKNLVVHAWMPLPDAYEGE